MDQNSLGEDMKVFDEEMNEISEPDLELGRLEERSKPITHHYVVDVEEITHEEVIREYPNGGKDVIFVIDVEEEGHWEARDENGNIVESADVIPDDAPHELDIPSVHRWLVYIPYTTEELAEIEAAKQAEAEALAEAEAREAYLAAAPVVQAEQDAAICELYEQSLAMQVESDQAITDLYEMLLEVSNG